MAVEFSKLILCGVLMAIVGGCSTDDSGGSLGNNSEEPETPALNFKDSVSAAMKLRDTIRDGFAAGDVDAAHGPLHEIGHALLAIPDAAAAELNEEETAKASDAVEELMDAFGAVDKTLHGGDGSTYEEEALTIDNGFKTLAELAGITAGSAEPQDESGEDNATSAEDLANETAPPIEDAPPIQDAVEIQDASSPAAP